MGSISNFNLRFLVDMVRSYSNLTNEGNDGGAQGDAPTPLTVMISHQGSPDYSV
jgi:hypothetical protein